MKRMLSKFLSLLLILLLFSGCQNSGSDEQPTEAPATPDTTPGVTSGDPSVGNSSTGGISSIDGFTVNYTKYDTGEGFSGMPITEITLSDSGSQANNSFVAINDSVITIQTEGVYRFSGSLSEGRIIVNAGDDDHVCLILAGVSITSSSGNPITVENAKKTLISLEEATENNIIDNTPADGTASTAENTVETAAIFGMDDITIGGTGSLTVTGTTNGIVSRDKLKIMSGTITVTAEHNGVKGKDALLIRDGVLTVTAGHDAMKATDTSAVDTGFVQVEGGTLTLTAGDDGIQAETAVILLGGELTISAGGGSTGIASNGFGFGGWGNSSSASSKGIDCTSSVFVNGGTCTIDSAGEGIQGLSVYISGGTLSITADDDGINSNQSGANCFINISGGNIYVNAEGDGLDSNGSITISGGTILIDGPQGSGDGALDAETRITYTGGTLIAVGSSGMAQGLTPGENCYSLMVTYQQTQSAKTLIHIEDADGNPIFTYQPQKSYRSLVVALPALTTGNYALYSGGNCAEALPSALYTGDAYRGGEKLCDFTIHAASTSISSDGTENNDGFGGGFEGFGGGPHGGGPNGGGRGEMPNGEFPGGFGGNPGR